MEDGILNLSAHGDNESVFDQNVPFDTYQAADDGNEEVEPQNPPTHRQTNSPWQTMRITWELRPTQIPPR